MSMKIYVWDEEQAFLSDKRNGMAVVIAGNIDEARELLADELEVNLRDEWDERVYSILDEPEVYPVERGVFCIVVED